MFGFAGWPPSRGRRRRRSGRCRGWLRQLDVGVFQHADLMAAAIDRRPFLDDESELRAVRMRLDGEAAHDAPAMQQTLYGDATCRVDILLVGEVAFGQQFAAIIVVAAKCRDVTGDAAARRSQAVGLGEAFMNTPFNKVWNSLRRRGLIEARDCLDVALGRRRGENRVVVQH